MATPKRTQGTSAVKQSHVTSRQAVQVERVAGVVFNLEQIKQQLAEERDNLSVELGRLAKLGEVTDWETVEELTGIPDPKSWLASLTYSEQ